MSIIKLNQELQTLTNQLMQARADGNEDLIEELEAELAEVEEFLEDAVMAEQEDHRFGRM